MKYHIIFNNQYLYQESFSLRMRDDLNIPELGYKTDFTHTEVQEILEVLNKFYHDFEINLEVA